MMLNPRDISVKQKLTIVIVLISASVLIISSTVFITFDSISIRQDVVNEMSLLAEVISDNSAAAITFGYDEDAEELLSSLGNRESILRGIIYRDTTVFAEFYRDEEIRASSIHPVNLQPGHRFYKNYCSLTHQIFLNEEPLGFLYIESDLSAIRDKLTRYIMIILFILVATYVFVVLIGSQLRRFIVGPILELSHTAQLISSEQNFSLRAKKEHDDEIGALVVSFNDMLDQIELRDRELIEARDQAEEKAEIARQAAEEAERSNKQLQIEIQEKELAKEISRKSEEKYRSLIEQSNDAIYLLYKQRFEIVNNRFKEVFSVTDEDLKHITMFELLTDKGRKLMKNRADLRKHGIEIPSQFEFTAKTKDGRELDVEASVAELPYKDGVAYQGILRDVSARKQLEQQLRQNQKMEAIGRLAGGIAHDFNNLLTVILGNTELAFHTLSSPDQMNVLLHEIQKTSLRAAELTSQLLTFSRKKILKKEYVDINAVINDMKSMLVRLIGEHITLQSDLEKEIPCILADPTQIQQVIINLVVNARDAMPNGGHITIETSRIHGGDFATAMDLVENQMYVQMKVSDTGSGISPELLPHLFEPFYSTKSAGRGTGLGLATVYAIVQQSNGFISVDSTVGKGSTFTIVISAYDEPGKQEHSAPKEIENLRGTETILLVEDEDSVRDVTAKTLVSYQYNVIPVSNPLDAIDRFKQDADKYDLILSDIVMPKMSGLEMIEVIRKINPNIRVLMMSGYAEEAISQYQTFDKSLPLLAKPFEVKELLRHVRRVLDKDIKIPDEKSSNRDV